MTIKRNISTDPRNRPIPEHAYTLPVVRELPPTPPDPVGTQLLW
jgi:hypothetical protein